MVSLFRIGRLRIIALVTLGLAFLASMSASAGMIRDTEIEAGLRDMLKPLEVAAGYPAGGCRRLSCQRQKR